MPTVNFPRVGTIWCRAIFLKSRAALRQTTIAIERPLELWVKKHPGMKTTTTWWSVAARTTRITGWLLIFQPTTIETD